jgi:hypothetical protein
VTGAKKVCRRGTATLPFLERTIFYDLENWDFFLGLYNEWIRNFS